MSEKFKVGVIYGGESGEHEVSLVSAHWVIDGMNRDNYEPIAIGIDKQGQCWLNALDEVYKPDIHSISVKGSSSEKILLEEARAYCDIIFPAMHGPLYEDGHLQGALTLAKLPFVGPNLMACAVSMDKVIAKRIAASISIPIAPWVTVNRCEFFSEQKEKALQKISSQLKFPLFVKAANLGSSVGLYLVENIEALNEGIANAFNYDTKVLVEEKIVARELEVAVLENKTDPSAPRTTPPGEITVSAKHTFYSYEAKYEDPEGASTTIPANIPDSLSQRCQQYAKALFSEIAGSGMARIDFLYDEKADKLYFNELNPLPGLTPISLYPKLWEHEGLTQKALISELLELALMNHEQTQQLERNYTK